MTAQEERHLLWIPTLLTGLFLLLRRVAESRGLDSSLFDVFPIPILFILLDFLRRLLWPE